MFTPGVVSTSGRWKVKRQFEIFKDGLGAVVNQPLEHLRPFTDHVHGDEILLQELQEVDGVAGDSDIL